MKFKKADVFSKSDDLYNIKKYRSKLMKRDKSTNECEFIAGEVREAPPGGDHTKHRKSPSTRQFLMDFMKEQRKFNEKVNKFIDKQDKFNKKQDKFNRVVIKRLDNLENELHKTNTRLDTVIKLNNLRSK